ncbi:ArdC family protein [Enterovibrio calviensis]|uniref:ArdC family protein n=1 Tax=Enterovibrio calviensis TaxID=91359 RepID=UPI003735310A
MKTDFYQQITNQIITALENGVKPWVCPWERSRFNGLPYSLQSQKTYSGINVLLLWGAAAEHGYSSPAWLTYKQAKSLGGQVRKGEKGTQIVFYKTLEKETDNGDKEKIPMLRTFTVFNLDQIDDIASPEATEKHGGGGFDALDYVEGFVASTGAIVNERGDRAFFSPSQDQITMPDRERFNQANDYYATLLHELAHWTGHKSRLDRKGGKRFGDSDYAFEELVAELGAAFMCADLGISGDVQHESYIASWLDRLKDDKRFIFKAASAASKAHQLCVDLAFSLDRAA